MTPTSLDVFTAAARAAWGPISTDLVRTCRLALGELTRTDETEPWLAELKWDQPPSRELYRDPQHGFVLLAHAEPGGTYRPPHDHGRAWVIYGVQSGALEVRTYANVLTPDGAPELVLREETVLRPGDARAYLPGDIHDTRCLSETAMLFRFTERDMRCEDLAEGRVTRFVENGGVWTVPGA